MSNIRIFRKKGQVGLFVFHISYLATLLIIHSKCFLHFFFNMEGGNYEFLIYVTAVNNSVTIFPFLYRKNISITRQA